MLGLFRTEEAFHVDQYRRPLSAEATQHFQRIVRDQASVFHSQDDRGIRGTGLGGIGKLHSVFVTHFIRVGMRIHRQAIHTVAA